MYYDRLVGYSWHFCTPLIVVFCRGHHTSVAFIWYDACSVRDREREGGGARDGGRDGEKSERDR